MEPFTTAKILEFVVGAVITLGVENLPAATKKLWLTIRNRLQNRPVAVAAIQGIEENQSEGEIPKLMPFLDVEMLSDETFKQQIHQLAEAAMNQDRDIINQTVINPQKNTIVGTQKADNITNNNADNITNIGTQFNVKK
jgi:hypothetical protein